MTKWVSHSNMKQFYHPMTKKNFFQLNAQSDYEIAYRLKLPFTAKLLQRTSICIGTLKGNRNSKVLHTLY